MDVIVAKYAEIREVVQRWLEDVTDYPSIFAEESSPRPDAPYTAFKFLTSLQKIGAVDEQIPATSSRAYKIRHFRQFTLSIQAFGRRDDDEYISAGAILSHVQNTLDVPTVAEVFRDIGLSLVSEGSVTDISQELDTEVEPRAVLDIIFNVCFETEDDPGVIESVAVRGLFDLDGDGDPEIDSGVTQIGS